MQFSFSIIYLYVIINYNFYFGNQNFLLTQSFEVKLIFFATLQ